MSVGVESQPSSKPTEPMLQVVNLDKRYGGVHALRNVSWQVFAGEVCGLVGENGAGKSTLIKMISGAEQPDIGKVIIAGSEITLGNTQAALASGVSAVYQEPQLFAELTVSENIFLGREITSHGRIRWSEQTKQVAQLLRRLDLDPALMNRQVGDLSVGEQQLISIAKAFAINVRLLILDEPSAILTNSEIEKLFTIIRKIREEGVAVIYISHRLDELTEITDRITVMRDGGIVGEYRTENMSPTKIAQAMVGEGFNLSKPKQPSSSFKATGEPIVRVENLVQGQRLRSASFSLYRGEILGVYGLIGSGANELARCLSGVTRPSSGVILVDGVEQEIASPRRAMELGITLLPGNRKLQGIFSPKSLSFNISSSHLGFFSKTGILNHRQTKSVTNSLIERLKIKAPSSESIISSLSGGNQQKVVMGRQLVENPVALIAEEPTQGVDVGAKAEIHDLIRRHVCENNAALVLSTDLDEIMSLCDRIIVLQHGVTALELPGDVDAVTLLAAASGDFVDGVDRCHD